MRALTFICLLVLVQELFAEGAEESPVVQVRRIEDLNVDAERITAILSVKFVSAEGAQKALQPLLPQGCTLELGREANALVFIGPKNQARRMYRIIQALDQCIDRSAQIEVIELRYSEAKAMAQILNEIFSIPSPSTSSASSPPSNLIDLAPLAPEALPPEQSNSRTSVNFLAVADESANRLVIRSTQDLLPQILKLVQTIDQPSVGPQILRIFWLKQADTIDFQTLISNLFLQITSSDVQQDANARRERSEEMSIVADSRTNALIVRASEKRLQSIETLISIFDSNAKGKKKLFFYSPDHADPKTLSSILQSVIPALSTRSE